MSTTSWSLSEGSIDRNVDTLEQDSIEERESVVEEVSVSSDWFSDCISVQQSLNSALTADSESVQTTDASAEVRLDAECGITASPIDTVENSQQERKSRGICAFFQRTWKSVKRPFLRRHRTRVGPVVPPLQPDTQLENTPNTESSVPEPSPDTDEPSSETISSVSQLSPGVDSAFEEEMPDRDSGVPEPLSVPDPDTVENSLKERKRRGICAFFQKTWKSVKRPFLRRHRTRVGPVVPPLQPDTQPTHDADPAVHKNTPDTDSSEPSSDTDLAFAEALSVPVSSFIESTDGDVESHYIVGRLLGSGGFGMVYEGTRKSDGQKVAIKYLSKWEDDCHLVIPGHSKPLLTEVALMLMMREPPISPCVVQMFEWFEDPSDITIIMEYPHPCESLQDFMYHHDELNNILVNPCTLQLKLIDFGCGQLFSSAAYHRSQYRGAAAYCPPEVLAKTTFHAVPANIWSLGLIMFEMVNGCLPYDKSEEVLFVNPDLSGGCT